MKWIIADKNVYLEEDALVFRSNKEYYTISRNILAGDKYILMSEFNNLPSTTASTCVATLESCF